MGMISTQYFNTPMGELILGSYDNKLCLADWRYRKMREQIDSRLQKGLNAEYAKNDTEVLNEARKQLNEYFNHQRTVFDLPLLFVGSDFQKSVWQELMQIPFGSTASYRQLAKNIGNEKAVRAVANANGANAISIFVPCHRIIGADGTLTGYAGGLDTKRKLLQLEGNSFRV